MRKLERKLDEHEDIIKKVHNHSKAKETKTIKARDDTSKTKNDDEHINNEEANSNDEKDYTFLTPITPEQKECVNLPYQTPANLQRSISDELFTSPD